MEKAYFAIVFVDRHSMSVFVWDSVTTVILAVSLMSTGKKYNLRSG